MTNPYDPEAETYQTPAYEYPATYGVQVPQPYLYPSSHTPVLPPKKTPKWVLVAIVAAVVAFLALGTLAVVKAPEKTNAATPTASVPNFSITARPKLPKTDKEKMRAWVLETRSNDQLSLIKTNMDNIGGAALSDPVDYDGLQSNCHDLTINAQLFLNSLPTPFPELTYEFNQSMTNYMHAGEVCQNLTADSTAAEIQPATDFITEGNLHMIRANAIVDGYK